MTRVAHRFLRRFASISSVLVWALSAIPADMAAAPASQTTRKGVARATEPASANRTTTARKTATKKTSSSTKARRAARYSSSRSATRRARLARARAQRERELREAATPRYKLDDSGSVVPDLRAEAAIVYNPVTQQVLWAQNENDSRSIASITKVMTAIVFLEDEFDLSREVVVSREDVRGARVTHLRAGERITVDGLLHLLLIASDNAAARTLARISPMGTEPFIARMNAKATELGLTSTHYADPSGLYSDNVSSAFDMARLIAFASADERIAPIMRTADYSVRTSRRTVSVHNTNRLVGSEIDVRGGKTGFIRKSGYCLATLLRLPDYTDPVAVVVLGARSNAGRFWETRHIFNWLASQTVAGQGGKTFEQ